MKLLPAPRAQEIRDLFLSTSDFAGKLLYHEGEQLFYSYDNKGYWKQIQPHAMQQTIDDFLVVSYGKTHNISVTTRTINDVIDSLTREGRSNFLQRFPANQVSAHTAFMDKTIDMRTLETFPHNPKLRAFHYVPFPLPTSASPTPAFDRFLRTTFVKPNDFEPDEQLIEFILDCLAYYFTPLNPRPLALIVQGSGGNGKSVLLDLLTVLIGEQFTCSLSLEDLSSRFGAADLAGRRLNVVSEDPARLADASKVKALISQDMVSVERKFHDRTKFRPTAKHIFSTNKDIRFENIDEATMRRIHIVPFHRLFRPANDPRIDGKMICVQDPDLLWSSMGEYKGKLVDELPGIYFKIMERLRKLIANGYEIGIPKQILETKNEAQTASSSALEFIHENYEVSLTSEALIPNDDLYFEYLEWYAKEARSDRFKLKQRQFFAILSKNMPETVTEKKITKNGLQVRAKAHLVKKSTISQLMHQVIH